MTDRCRKQALPTARLSSLNCSSRAPDHITKVTETFSHGKNKNALTSNRDQRACDVEIADPSLCVLRSPEQLAGVDVAGQSARRNTAQIVRTSGVRAEENSRSPGWSAERITSRWRRTVFAGTVFLNGVTDERASGSADGGADEGASATASTGDVANDRAGARAGRGALASRRIAGIKPESGERNAANNCEKLLVHSRSLTSPLNRPTQNMLRVTNEFV